MEFVLEFKMTRVEAQVVLQAIENDLQRRDEEGGNKGFMQQLEWAYDRLARIVYPERFGMSLQG